MPLCYMCRTCRTVKIELYSVVCAGISSVVKEDVVTQCTVPYLKPPCVCISPFPCQILHIPYWGVAVSGKPIPTLFCVFKKNQGMPETVWEGPENAYTGYWG